MRYFLGYIVTIGLLIVLILFLITSNGGGKHNAPAQVRLLNSYANTDAQVRLTIDGPINANQSHQQVQITADAFEITFDQVQGYDGTVVNHQSYSNTQNAYYAFLTALMQAGFTKGVSSTTVPNDTGLCPLGDRYNFLVTQNGQAIQNYWATTCGGLATYKGNINLTLELFQAQVPDYDRLTSNVAF
jgi:hypothetical protein